MWNPCPLFTIADVVIQIFPLANIGPPGEWLALVSFWQPLTTATYHEPHTTTMNHFIIVLELCGHRSRELRNKPGLFQTVIWNILNSDCRDQKSCGPSSSPGGIWKATKAREMVLDGAVCLPAPAGTGSQRALLTSTVARGDVGLHPWHQYEEPARI